MIKDIRRFALVALDEYDTVLSRFNLDYADTPKNLGFELEFTTLESKLTTYFTSAREKKTATTLNINFVPPNAYEKVNSFKRFVQTYMNKRIVFEYHDTVEIKQWEGKVQKLGQEELQDWGGLVCPIAFLPSTPKYIKSDNTFYFKKSVSGKSYPYKYPYSYGKTSLESVTIDNTYFDEIPLKVIFYGSMNNPEISLQDFETEEVYSTIRFKDLHLSEGEHLIVDATQAKILLWRNDKYISAYSYLDKSSSLDTFLYAKANVKSTLIASISSGETGYIQGSYYQYTL